MNVQSYNRTAWDKQVENKNPWTVPVSAGTITAARNGEWEIVLTPTRPVPRKWFPDMAGLDVLCLASGGGQQGPILAATGATVTVLDNSPKQLEQDRFVAQRDRLQIRTVVGDMADLSILLDDSFDLIVHPVSNCFVPRVRPVWAEAFRVLRPGGALLAGFANPVIYVFDLAQAEEGIYIAKYALPYSDLTSLSPEERARVLEPDSPLEFSHTLEDQISGQLEAGFVITGFYEDIQPGERISDYMPSYMATRAIKPSAAGEFE
jgi:SAM-dependent methyltransferase